MSDRATYDRPSYRSAKEELEKSAGRIRVYGIQLDKPDDDATAIWFCGYRADVTDYRMGSKRIFHVPTQQIVRRGNVDGFKYEGHQVQWFDVDPRTRLLEECFFAFEASSLLEPHTKGDNLTVLERLHGTGSTHFLPHLRVGPVPIIIPLDPPGPSPVPIIIPLDPPGPSPVPIIIPLDPA
jgi:hypothetical protein